MVYHTIVYYSVAQDLRDAPSRGQSLRDVAEPQNYDLLNLLSINILIKRNTCMYKYKSGKHIYTYVCIYIHMYVYVYIHIYIYIHIHIVCIYKNIYREIYT